MKSMYYIRLDVHKKTISYCVKDGSGNVHAEGAIPATRSDLDSLGSCSLREPGDRSTHERTGRGNANPGEEEIFQQV